MTLARDPKQRLLAIWGHLGHLSKKETKFIVKQCKNEKRDHMVWEWRT